MLFRSLPDSFFGSWARLIKKTQAFPSPACLMQPNAATGGLFTHLFFFAFSGQSLLSLPQSSQTLMTLLLTNILAFSNVFPQSIPISSLLPFAQYLFPISYLSRDTYFQSLTYCLPLSSISYLLLPLCLSACVILNPLPLSFLAVILLSLQRYDCLRTHQGFHQLFWAAWRCF